jgi:hypothetical protein
VADHASRRSPCTAGTVESTLRVYTEAVRTAKGIEMASTALGMSRGTLEQVLTGGAVVFGVAGVLAPGALGATYGVPSSPHTTQLLRLFGSRMLALAAWSSTARTKEETDRMLAVSAGMNVVDTLTALRSASSVGRATAMRAAATSAFFAAFSLVVRSLED